jgi:NADH:ubiquinone oxidoreductase subunit 6 (subunit J)
MGWVCVLFAFVVMFFNPAALKRGDIAIEVIAALLVVGGLVMNLVGSRIRARNQF